MKIVLDFSTFLKVEYFLLHYVELLEGRLVAPKIKIENLKRSETFKYISKSPNEYEFKI